MGIQFWRGDPHVPHISDSGEPCSEMINYVIQTHGWRRRGQIVVKDTAFPVDTYDMVRSK